jgi:hypothetical protein
MNWIKRAVNKWLNSEKVSIDSRNYATEARHNNVPQVSLIKAMNGTVLQLQHYKQSTKLHGDSTLEVSYYVLKEGDNLPDAVAALLVNYKLDNR